MPEQHPGGERLVLLRGGVRDGQVTRVPAELTRLLAMSNAPGLVDVYEWTESLAETETGVAEVFDCVGQEPAEEFAPEMQHMPGDNPVPGDA